MGIEVDTTFGGFASDYPGFGSWQTTGEAVVGPSIRMARRYKSQQFDFSATFFREGDEPFENSTFKEIELHRQQVDAMRRVVYVWNRGLHYLHLFPVRTLGKHFKRYLTGPHR